MFKHDYKQILFERKGRVLRVTLNRPEKLNAVGGELHHDLSCLFQDLASDAQSDVIVLTGAGNAFSAGGDLDYLSACHEDPARFARSVREAKQIINGLLDCDKPIICRMNGDAVGLGATIALFCDIIIAADTARIGDPHVKVGLVAGDGGAVIWPQLIGYVRAKQYLMTGDLITAQDACGMGLINFAVPPAELEAKVEEWTERLTRGATLAIRSTKSTINIGLKQLASAILDAGLVAETLSGQTDDHREAIAAFRERRAPRFQGR
ncbi:MULTISPECIES: enoyl-CoA hydratase-related protein [unclassified Chelatococcus]|uniref:enoyl-CoA hydratase/isomerase family protein n=1 Tax=unclassified Chelatococcus TaxID=2638111 RepID=UPI001BD1665D|nr:enoyl-CoA hydratase-related protein [Chelatococcus sp.]MBS7701216.1 enoyl-CoA hydratase/isomerase family protein [Chelatococcus sp. YT9]MBX3557347.1 enoyl-CoA hydratase/isomerase family protein [Chelatococcus sp.]